MYRIVVVFIILGFLIIPFTPFNTKGVSSFNRSSKFQSRLNITDALKRSPSGTPPRKEMETKLLIEGPRKIITNNKFLLQTMKKGIESALLNDLQWAAPQCFGTSYSISPIGLGTFCFLDIYLDSPDFINMNWNISHRVRYRWHSRGAFFRYLLGSNANADLPHRCEFQVKTDRNEQIEGFYCSNETRFEFRNESFPFKKDNSAPLPPWPFEEFIPSAINGNFGPYFTTSTSEYAKFLSNAEPNRTNVELAPSLLLVTTRRRIHLNLPTPFGETGSNRGFGSSTNSNQAMIITFDTSEVFSPDLLQLYFLAHSAKKQNGLSKRLLKRFKKNISVAGVFAEVEIEFERNVESALHEEMSTLTDPAEKIRAKKIETAFLNDQKTMAKIIRENLEKAGLNSAPSNVSKYRKGCQILANSEFLSWKDYGQR